MYSHVLQTRFLDNHGLASKNATSELIKRIRAYNPDVIGLHNLHGYYLNYKILFEFLKLLRVPVIWTFHDCWPFTGHCSYFDRVSCNKWKRHCNKCPLKSYYPASYFADRSQANFIDKKISFTGHPNLTIVTPSMWLKRHVKQSFLQKYPVEVINNGVDTDTFYPKQLDTNSKIALGVASVWSKRKGLQDFIELREKLNREIQIVLIGLSQKQIAQLPAGIIGVERTESISALAEWYSKATVFCNPTYIDNFPTTNIEALACGTKVLTYKTGGSPEAVCENTGKVIEQGDVKSLAIAIESERKTEETIQACRSRAVQLFEAEMRFNDYYKLYQKKLS